MEPVLTIILIGEIGEIIAAFQGLVKRGQRAGGRRARPVIPAAAIVGVHAPAPGAPADGAAAPDASAAPAPEGAAAVGAVTAPGVAGAAPGAAPAVGASAPAAVAAGICGSPVTGRSLDGLRARQSHGQKRPRYRVAYRPGAHLRPLPAPLVVRVLLSLGHRVIYRLFLKKSNFKGWFAFPEIPQGQCCVCFVAG